MTAHPHSVPDGHGPSSAGTSHTGSTAPARDHLPAAGPAATLLELPDPAEVTLTVPGEVDAYLSQIETARQRQLDAMPSTNLDTVAAAYWTTVERILHEVRTARQRVVAGLYGICTRCHGEIPLQRLELRPWAAMCTRCSSQ
jgi:DnaK suppressor protein